MAWICGSRAAMVFGFEDSAEFAISKDLIGVLIFGGKENT
jgi:hypothetical protein